MPLTPLVAMIALLEFVADRRLRESLHPYNLARLAMASLVVTGAFQQRLGEFPPGLGLLRTPQNRFFARPGPARKNDFLEDEMKPARPQLGIFF